MPERTPIWRKQEDVTGDEINLAWQHLEHTVRDRRLGTHPETKKLRRSLAEIFGRVGRYQDALDHLGYLIEKDPERCRFASAESHVLDPFFKSRQGH